MVYNKKNQREYYIKNKEKVKQYQLKNKEKIKEQKKYYYEKNKEKLLKYGRNHYKNNKKKYYKKYYQKPEVKIKQREHHQKFKDWYREYSKIYRENNKEKYIRLNREWRRKNKGRRNALLSYRRKTDFNFRLKMNLHKRIYDALKNNKKYKKTMELIGCSFEYLKNYIECQFDDEMSWSNWGMKGWHIDHIIPCVSFDLSKGEEQQKCFHYSNLQPLWAEINMSKGSKVQ